MQIRKERIRERKKVILAQGYNQTKGKSLLSYILKRIREKKEQTYAVSSIELAISTFGGVSQVFFSFFPLI